MFGYSHKYSQGVKDKPIANMLYLVALRLKVLYYTVCDSGSIRNEELFPSTSKLLLKSVLCRSLTSYRSHKQFVTKAVN
jgi:hypothetical protein